MTSEIYPGISKHELEKNWHELENQLRLFPIETLKVKGLEEKIAKINYIEYTGQYRLFPDYPNLTQPALHTSTPRQLSLLEYIEEIKQNIKQKSLF